MFNPKVGKFAFDGLNAEYYKIILFEEFENDYHSVNLLKRLLEEIPFCVPQKHGQGRVFTIAITF